MKKLIFSILAILLLYPCFSQTVFWTVYNIKVNAGEEEKVMNALDKFFTSETGKSLPIVSINGTFFMSSEEDYTHQVIFSTTDKKVFGEMYSGGMNKKSDFQLMANVLDQNSTAVASYLGKSIDMTPGPPLPFHTLIGLSVADAATYLAEFKKLKSAAQGMWPGKVRMDLHEFLSGNEPGTSHIAVVSALDFETLLDFSDKIYSSPAFKTFAKNVHQIRKTTSNSTNVTLKMYNLPVSGN